MYAGKQKQQGDCFDRKIVIVCYHLNKSKYQLIKFADYHGAAKSKSKQLRFKCVDNNLFFYKKNDTIRIQNVLNTWNSKKLICWDHVKKFDLGI